MAELNPQDVEEIAYIKFELEPDSEPEQVTRICDHCLCTSSFVNGFQKHPSRNKQSERYLCNTCAVFRIGKRATTSRLFDALIFVAFLGVIAYSAGISHIALLLVKWFFMLHLAIFVHEFAHYSMTRVVGYKARLMVLGAGPVLKVIRFSHLLLVVKLLPFGGLVHPDIKSPANARVKFALIVLAGPLSNILMAVIAAKLLYFSDNSLSPVGMDLLGIWFVVNTMMGILNLVPFRTMNAVGTQRSDGQYLIDLPTWTDEDISTLIKANQTLVAQVEFQYGDKHIARAMAIDAIQSGLDIQAYSGLLTVSATTRDELALAIQINRQALEINHPADESLAMIQNNLAYSLFQYGDNACLAEADALSLKAMETLPMLLSVRSTRGSVLIAMGRYEEGLKLLEDERFTIETKENQARVLYVRARAYEALGLVDDAAQSIQKAEKLAPKVALQNEFSCEDDVEFTKAF